METQSVPLKELCPKLSIPTNAILRFSELFVLRFFLFRVFIPQFNIELMHINTSIQ